eukprot:5378456-Lingulodinium_polyedra.AAC.1
MAAGPRPVAASPGTPIPATRPAPSPWRRGRAPGATPTSACPTGTRKTSSLRRTQTSCAGSRSRRR